MRQKLCGRGQEGALAALRAALGQHVKEVERVDYVSEKLHAKGLLHARRKDVDNAAARRELPRPLHQLAARVAGIHKPFEQRFGRNLHAAAQLDAGLRKQGGRQRKLHGRVGRGQHHLRPLYPEQRRNSLVHELARGPLHPVQHQIHCGVADRAHRQPLQLFFQAAAFGVVGAQHKAALLPGKQAAQKGLSRRGKAGQRNGRLPLRTQLPKLCRLGQRPEFFHELFHRQIPFNLLWACCTPCVTMSSTPCAT